MDLAEINLAEIELELKRRRRLEVAGLRERVRTHQLHVQRLESQLAELNAAPLGRTPAWVLEALTR